jgi:hypothetical protein
MECCALRLGVCNCTQLNILAPLFKQEFIIVSFTSNNNIMSQTDIDLYWAVRFERRELVVALLAAGADANQMNNLGTTSAFAGAAFSTAGILQLLINGGGNVNEQDTYGQTPLIAVVLGNKGDAAVRLQMLLACPELDLGAKYEGKTGEEWAAKLGYMELAVAIAEERARRERWVGLRVAWIAATVSVCSCSTANRSVYCNSLPNSFPY